MSDNPRTTFKIERPIIHPSGPITELVLRDPLYPDYRALGDPWTIVYDEQGRGAPVDREDIIFGYVERCLVEPKSALLLEHLTLGDARKLRKWVERFFQQGVAATEGSTTSSPTSSGDPAVSPSPKL